MTKQTNTRLPERTLEQIEDLRNCTGPTKTGVLVSAVDKAWREVFEISFNRACTQLGITADRRAFHDYWATVRNDECQCHTVEMWETIYRCYEDKRDSDDERDTQRDALS